MVERIMEAGRRILKNMFSLSAAEIANKGISLVTLAYLARVLTPEGLGVIGWANAFVLYFVFFVDLGFNVIGPREIAKNHEAIRRYVNNISTIKILSSVVSYICLVIIAILIDKPIESKYVLLISGLNVFANSILFNWVFQGIEKMGVIAVRQVTTSVLNLVGVLVFVHNQNDLILAMVIMIGSLLLNSFWMFFYYVKMYGWIKFEFDFVFWKELLKSSTPIALTLFIVTLYNNFSIFLLGILRTDFETGIYIVAFKMLTFVLIPTGIFQYAFLPQLSRSQTLGERQRITGKYVLLTILFGTILTAGCFTFSDFITVLGFGSKYKDSAIVIRMLMVSGMLAYLNVSYSAPLLSWNYEKKVFWAMLSGGVVNIVLNLILIPKFGVTGAGIASISTEITVLIVLSTIMYSVIKELYLKIFFKLLFFAIISCVGGYYLMIIGLYPLMAGTISLLIYIGFNFYFKTIRLTEIKEVIKKKQEK
jgi:O-antigen/teichoic acid export membrane protein